MLASITTVLLNTQNTWSDICYDIQQELSPVTLMTLIRKAKLPVCGKALQYFVKCHYPLGHTAYHIAVKIAFVVCVCIQHTVKIRQTK